MLVVSAASPPPEPVRSLAGWTALELTGDRFLVASARSRLERWPAGAAEPDESLLRVTTTVSLFGARSGRHEVDASSRGNPPATTRWIEIQQGKRARAMRVDGDRLVATRHPLPHGQPAPLAGAWGKPDKTLEVALPATRPACGAVDPYTLLLQLPCLAAGPDRRALLLSRDGAALVGAVRREKRPFRRALLDLDTGRTVEAELMLQRLELVREGGGTDGPSAFGMVGGVSIWIDEASGTVVEIEGRHENVPGTIRLQLRAVSRRAGPRPAPPWPGPSAGQVDAGRAGS